MAELSTDQVIYTVPMTEQSVSYAIPVTAEAAGQNVYIVPVPGVPGEKGDPGPDTLLLIGDMATLTTVDKSTVVAAINETREGIGAKVLVLGATEPVPAGTEIGTVILRTA